MSWYRRLIAQQTPYGYWITRDARRIPVGSEAGHYDAIKDRGFKDYAEAFQAGWVRLVIRQTPQSSPIVNAWVKPSSNQIAVILSCFEEAHVNPVMVSTHWYNGWADTYYGLDKALMGRAKSPMKMVPQKPGYVGEGKVMDDQKYEAPMNQPVAV